MRDQSPVRRIYRINLEISFLQKTVIVLPIKDDVIEKPDAKNLSGLLDLLRGIYVCRRGFKTSSRVVVRHDDTRSAVRQRISEDFTRMNWAAVDQPNGHDPDIENFVGPVDGGAEKMLLLAVGKMSNQGEQIRRRSRSSRPPA